MTGRSYFDHIGRPVLLGPRLGDGAEGTVYDIVNDPESVAKIYDKKPIPADQEPKLRSMLGMPATELRKVAPWPTSTLYGTQRGAFHGFVMPKIKAFQEIHVLYSPANRKITFPDVDWRYLIHTALNLAEAMETLHSCGMVMGDVSHRNVVVLPRALVLLADCDSYQVIVNGRCYYSNVGTEEFTPPELQNQNLRGILRTQNHDQFGLAILIFLLLFMNRHPFAGRYLGTGDMPIKTAIAENRFAYGQLAPNFQMQVPVHAPALSLVPPFIADLFERAFAPVSAKNNGRPTARQWAAALKTLVGSLRSCIAPGHVFAPHLSRCPWCALVEHGAPDFFVSVAYSRTVGKGGATFVLAAVWARIENVPSPIGAYARPAMPPTPMPAPWPAGVGRAMTPMPLPPGILRSPRTGSGIAPKPTPPTILSSPPTPPNVDAGWPTRDRQNSRRTSSQVTAGLSSIGGGVACLLLLFFGAVFALAGESGTGGALALLALGPLVVFVAFGLWWVVQETNRKELERALNREYDAELLSLRLEADRRLKAWQKSLTKKQAAARQLYEQALSRWEIEVTAIQAAARLRYDQEVAHWKGLVHPIQSEAQRRRNAVEEARRRLELAEQEWKSATAKFVTDFDAKKKHLKQLRDRHEDLGRLYVKERQELQSRVKETQRDQFLQQNFISDHEIDGIGRGRMATLSSYGIETALDVDRAKVLEVPGFGIVLTGRLVEWRRIVESRFVFNPAAGVPQQRQQALDAKYSQERQRIEMTLLSGERELKAATTASGVQLGSRFETIKELLSRQAQANADVALIPPGI